MQQKQFFPELIPFREGQQWGYSDRNKQLLITPQFSHAYPFVGDIAKVIQGEKVGLIRRDGSFVVPVEYDGIGSDMMNTLLNEDGSCTVRGGGKYGLVSPYGELLADVIHDSEEEAMEAAENKGWKGAIPSNHLPMMPKSTAREIDFVREFDRQNAPFRKAGKWGLITETGEILVEPIYEDIQPAENGYWPFCQAGKWGLIDTSGKIFIEARFDEARGFSDGQAACKQGGFWGAIDMEGNWVYEPRFTELGEFKEGLTAAEHHGHYGFVDEAGQVVVPFHYDNVMDFEGDISMVFEEQYQYVSLIDRSGKHLGKRYQRMFGPDKHNLIHVVEGDKWGLIKPTGEFVLPIQYDLPRAMGQVLQTIEAGRIPIKRGPLLGFADFNGKELVEPTYMMVDPYWEGMALVSVMHPRLNFGKTPESIEASGSISGVFEYGFLDMEGKEVIPPKYILARRFQFGLARVETEDFQDGYITYDGTEYFEG